MLQVIAQDSSKGPCEDGVQMCMMGAPNGHKSRIMEHVTAPGGEIGSKAMTTA